MDTKQVEQAIRDKLREREKHVVNRNALAALLSAFKLETLSKIFLGRKDALETEKLRIQQEIVLDLLCKIDEAISTAKAEASKQLQRTELGENGTPANIPEVSSAGISSLVNFVKGIAACIYHVLSGLQKHFGNSPC